MMARNAELHAAVLAAPDDDAPRLVYADWLIERGDPRGELIVLQIERARLGAGDPRFTELVQREFELLRAHGEWRTPYKSVKVELVRGFAETLSGEATDLATMPEAMLDDACIRTLSIHDRWHGNDLTSELEAIGQLLPRLRLRHLELARLTLSAASLRALLAALARNPMQLAALAITYAALDADHVAAIVGSPALAQLHALTLGNCELAGTSLLELARWHPVSLRALGLRGNPIGEGYITTILDRPAFAELERLDLAATRIGPGDLRDIVARRMPLVALELGQNTLGSQAIAALTQELFGDRLDRLGLADTAITTADLDALIASKLPRLELGLDGYVLGLYPDIWYDQGVEIGASWKGSPPAALAARFRIRVEGSPN